MSTKKLLIAYDESKLIAKKGDFLAVVFDGTNPIFFGLKSHCAYKSGCMVFLGKEITEKDIFAKLVDTGRKIESVDKTLKTIASYIQQLESFKIGNVVGITSKSGELGFELFKVSEMPQSRAKQLP